MLTTAGTTVALSETSTGGAEGDTGEPFGPAGDFVASEGSLVADACAEVCVPVGLLSRPAMALVVLGSALFPMAAQKCCWRSAQSGRAVQLRAICLPFVTNFTPLVLNGGTI